MCDWFKRFLVLALPVAWSTTCLAESQIYFTDTCTLPAVGSSTASCSLSSSIGASSSLSYTRYNLYGGVHEEVPDGVTATGRFASLTSSNVRYGILFDTFEIFQSPTTNLEWAVSSTGSSCPASTTYNWLLVRTRTPDLLSSNDIFNQPMDFSSSSQYVGGTVSYSSSSFTGTDYFDLASLTDVTSSSGNWSSYGFNGYNSGTCSSGNFTVQGTGSNYPMDEYGYLYFGANSFFNISVGGNPVVTLGVVQQNLTSTVMSNLANDILTGFYTYYPSYLTQDQRTVYFVPNGSNFSGSTYEFDIYQSSTNLNGGSPTTSALTSSSQAPSSQTQLGKITCTSLNSPSQGFCSGTLDMSASGVSGTGNAVCEFYTGTTGHLIACTAQYPAKKNSAVTFIGQTPSSALLSNVVSSSGMVQMASPGSGSLTATITNLTGRAISSLGNPSSLGESSSLDLASPFTKPTYSGSSGVCGSSLPGYGSCTLSLSYSTSADGASIQTFRSAYGSGGNGTVNATAILVETTGLSSIAISNPTMGQSENLTATATFADKTTANISTGVTWSSSNPSIASITNDLGNSDNGYATLASSGFATISATLGTISTALSVGPSGYIQTIAGGSLLAPGTGVTGDGYPATTLAYMNGPVSTAIDSLGNLYIVDKTNNRIQMVPNASGTYFGQAMTAHSMYTIAGSAVGTSGSSADGGAATAALLNYPFGVAVDSTGNVYLSEISYNRIRMVVAAAGTYFGQVMTANNIYTIAGGITNNGHGGDGGVATAAALSSPYQIALDSKGNLYVSDYANRRIQMVPASSGTYFGQVMTASYMYTIAGSPTGAAGSTGDGGVATAALLYNPYGVAVDSSGNLYIADTQNYRVRMVAAVSGTYFGQVMAANDIYTIAGTGSYGYTGNGGVATAALLNFPTGVAVDGTGNVYIADSSNSRVQMVAANSGTYFGQVATAAHIYTVAGSATGTSGSTGAGGAATAELLHSPVDVVVDSSGNLYIVDTNNGRLQVIPKANGTYFGQSMTANNVYTIAGSLLGASGSSGDGGPASASFFNFPVSTALDSSGNIYIADVSNQRVQMISQIAGTYFGQVMAASDIYTIVGSTGSSGSTGDGGAATAALLFQPYGVAVDSGGNVFVADTDNNRIQMVPTATGTYFGQAMTANNIYTVAGSAAGSSGTTGDGGLATAALIRYPQGMAVDSTGNIYIADTNNARIQMVPAVSGTYFGQVMTAAYMYTIAGIPTVASGHTGNGGIATAAKLWYPEGVALDSSGNIYIADTNNARIQMVPALSGTYFGQVMTATYMYTIAGSSTGSSGFAGDGGAATSALLNGPNKVAVDAKGNLYVADYNNYRVAMVPSTSGTYFGQAMTASNIYTIAGSKSGMLGYYGDGGPGTSSLMDSPSGIAVSPSGGLYISDTRNNAIRVLYP